MLAVDGVFVMFNTKQENKTESTSRVDNVPRVFTLLNYSTQDDVNLNTSCFGTIQVLNAYHTELCFFHLRLYGTN